MLSRDCRHRLGSTVGGAVSSFRKAYGSRLQTVLPCGEDTFAFSMVPRKPRAASSKSRVSENGSALSVAACCAITEADASFGVSFGVSATAAAWVIRMHSLGEFSWDASAKRQSLELAALAPRIDIFEVGERTGGVA